MKLCLNCKSTYLINGISIILIFWGTLLLFRGTSYFLNNHPVSDLSHRLNGLESINNGNSPYRISEIDRIVAPDPPWSWMANKFIYTTDLSISKYSYLLWIILIITLICILGYRLGKNESKQIGILCLSSVYAISSICTSIGLGQNALISVGFLSLCYLLHTENKKALSGIALGLSLIKPQITGLFILPFIFKHQWKTLGTAALTCFISMSYLTLKTKIPIHLQILEWIHYVNSFESWPGRRLLDLMTWRGDKILNNQLLNASLFGFIAIALCYRSRKNKLLILFSITAICGRLWSYHQLYDNSMLLFPLLLMGIVYFRDSKNTVFMILWILMGLTLWIPGRIFDFYIIEYASMIFWLILLILIALRPNYFGKRLTII